MPVSSDIAESRRWKLRRNRFYVAESFVNYFPIAEFANYEAFLRAKGKSLKEEPRTRVTLLHLPSAGQPAGEFSSFVLKIYKYPLLPRIRTGFQISKAEREFNSLRCLNDLGLGAAQAVAFGVEGTSLGFVRSCFIITRFVDDALNLSQWYAQMKSRETLEVAGGEDVFSKLGQMFRILHEARFFLFTAKAKNILIRRNLPRSHEIIFIDVPYARTLKWWPLARWAQARDIGFFLGSIVPRLRAEAIDSFYRAYLPDPLGLSAKTVRRYVLRKMRAKQNLTPLSRWFHDIKRRLKGKNNPEAPARPSRKVTDG